MKPPLSRLPVPLAIGKQAAARRYGATGVVPLPQVQELPAVYAECSMKHVDSMQRALV